MSTESTARQTATAESWVQQARHTVVLPSGAAVVIRIPDINALIETGEIPQDLLAEATGSAAKPDEVKKPPTPAEAAKEREFKDQIVQLTVVDPEITPAMLDAKNGIPTEDKDMIVEFAMRQREFDVEGNHISGLHTSQKFLKFRGITDLYPNVEGAPGS